VDDLLIPTGQFMEVFETPFNFLEMKAIGADLDSVQGGYDHNFVLIEAAGKETGLAGHAAELYDPLSGRVMRLYTIRTRTAILLRQFFGRHDHRKKRTGLCKACRPLPGATAVPRFTQPTALSEYHITAR
jgi:hypothetical protein